MGDLGRWRSGGCAGYAGGLFVPVKDASPDTYGGGRYLLDTIKGADLGMAAGRLVVDLNFAYKPVLRVRPRVDVPLGHARQHARRRGPVGERVFS